MKDQRWWRSPIARRVSLAGAFVLLLLATLTARASVVDSVTGQFPFAGHWITAVVLGVVAFGLGAFYFGTREDDTTE
ncbi:hypothetical protein [Saccharopolyspora tripterygii]